MGIVPVRVVILDGRFAFPIGSNLQSRHPRTHKRPDLVVDSYRLPFSGSSSDEEKRKCLWIQVRDLLLYASIL